MQYFGTVVTQVDQNLVVMQIIEETAARHGLAALLQEKPFAGINGSGKHNNWSISTTEGAQLMVPSSLIEASGNPTTFPVVMAAVVAGVSKHGDMMRMVTFPTSPISPSQSPPGCWPPPSDTAADRLVVDFARRLSLPPATTSVSARWRRRRLSSRPTSASR